MRICLICVEIFAWSKYGGFGRATRTIGRELAKRGLEVSAVVPRREMQKEVETLDGITVYGFKPHQPWKALSYFKAIDADVFHSQEPSFGTYLAQKAMPHKRHVVTLRDTRTRSDWWQEFKAHSLSKSQVVGNMVFEDNPLVRHAVRHADLVCAASKFLIEKGALKYGLKRKPLFLPTPVNVPDKVVKSKTPLITYVARFDRRKRPDIFFDLAAAFPQTQFVAVGKARDRKYDHDLRLRYANRPNLHLHGFIDQFAGDSLGRIYERSWVFVNTASREGLPNAFIEAAAHKCAILSYVNPDDFARNFGYWVKDDGFAAGLRYLLAGSRWRQKGEEAYAYVSDVFETSRAIDQHLQLYRELLSR